MRGSEETTTRRYQEVSHDLQYWGAVLSYLFNQSSSFFVNTCCPHLEAPEEYGGASSIVISCGHYDLIIVSECGAQQKRGLCDSREQAPGLNGFVFWVKVCSSELT